MPTNPEPEPVWLSVKQLAARWSLSKRTIRTIKPNELPCTIISHSIRYRIEDVTRYEMTCSARGQRTLPGC